MISSNDMLLNILAENPEYLRLSQTLTGGKGPVGVYGLGEAHKGHLAATLANESGKCLLIVSANETSAARLAEDIGALCENTRHFPAREMLLYGKNYAASTDVAGRRLSILSILCAAKSMVLVASAQALLQRLAPPEAMLLSVLSLHTGQEIEPQALLTALCNAGYTREDVCESHGQVCRRGGYVDVFPINAEYPLRIEFYGDEIDTIRTFDPLTQRSLEVLSTAELPPACELPLSGEARQKGLAAMKGRPELSAEYDVLASGGLPDVPELLLPFFYDEANILDYLPQDALILMDEPARIEESARVAYAEFLEAVTARLPDGGAPELAELMSSPLEQLSRLGGPKTAMCFALTRTYGLIAPKGVFRFDTKPASSYLGNDDMLKEDILAWRKQGAAVLIYAGSHAGSLADSLMDMDIVAPVLETLSRMPLPGEVLIISKSIGRGFEYIQPRLAVISETELYGGAPRRKAAPRRQRPMLAFNELETGDLVVHELHGIGRFVGIKTLTVGDTQRDYLQLAYSGGDKLYIPTDQLDRVQKYVGGEAETQKLSKLGSGEWQRTVSRTRESVKKLAFDLVKLYGDRAKRQGFKYSADTPWQRRLEDGFPYEETPDQLACIAEIKQDMESGKVMDRLLCGDVGYGKTEVALRAAFKAVMDSKQVAFLVPTTILAQQHYNTLAARFSGFPVQVELLSRFKTPAEERNIREGLAEGSVDVVVGTHKLLADSLKFRDLGLLIIDEEQRFGVGHKEKIKNLRRNVDVLSLSATPIPRTLHMSMTGIRDMSLIETPPEQRYPVQTYVMEYSEAVTREAILKELGRGGQVYFVYNKVRSMEFFAGRLRELVPEARIAYAHGQMGEQLLEKTMLEFLEGQHDVLLCSTIIESGLDIPNVNTIIVYDADHMGLSQLYQLRGRVGRSSRLGYAYLCYRRDKVLTEVAEKRLCAIKEFTQFGSGFRIAMRDLEIRGAGNMLGPEQHGHMEAVGYELYCKLVNNAVKEARGEPVKREIDTVIEADINAHISKHYIPKESERLAMYKRIASITTNDDILDIRDELIDRYGDIPAPVDNLLFIAKLKADCATAYVLRLSLSLGEARFVFDPAAPYDGMKLLTLAQKEGAALTAGEEPVLVIKRRGRTPLELCKELPQFIYTLADCIDA